MIGRKKIIGILWILSFGLFSLKGFGGVKLAFVDLQRALNETEEGRRAKRQLKKLFTARQKALDKEQQKLKKMKEEIERQKNILSREALQKKLEEYQKAFIGLQSTYVAYQRELAEKESKLTKKIFSKMEKILRRIGMNEGYTMILEKSESAILWAPGYLDLTDKLIQEYNTLKEKKKK
jgi:outer membrane protein